jgi:hypothetical protein
VPLSLEGKLKLTDKVTIGLTNAKVRRMKIPTIQRFLNREESVQFRQFVAEQLRGRNAKVFVVYESFRTNKLKLTAEGGKDITTSVDIGQAVSVVSQAKGKFQYKRTTKSEIEITGDHYYAFAIRTGRLQPTADGGMQFVPGDFKFSGRLGGTDEEKYTQPILPDFQKVALGSLLDLPAS